MHLSLWTCYFQAQQKFDGFNFNCLVKNRQKYQNSQRPNFALYSTMCAITSNLPNSGLKKTIYIKIIKCLSNIIIHITHKRTYRMEGIFGSGKVW